MAGQFRSCDVFCFLHKWVNISRPCLLGDNSDDDNVMEKSFVS